MIYSPHGGHNIHLRYADEFNKYFHEFLENGTVSIQNPKD